MLSILTPEAPARDLDVLNELEQVEPGGPPAAEFEIVLGRLQVASVLFVGTVILVIVSAVSYLAGKTSGPRTAVAPQAAAQPQIPVLEATITKAPPPKPATARPEAPVFSDPVTGAVYLQMGAVDEGIAMLLVEGLRKRGFQAFAAPGPSEKIFRVLIGPLPDAEAFSVAREAVNQIGVITFVRKYQP
jgi:hypothetical protein